MATTKLHFSLGISVICYSGLVLSHKSHESYKFDFFLSWQWTKKCLNVPPNQFKKLDYIFFFKRNINYLTFQIQSLKYQFE